MCLWWSFSSKNYPKLFDINYYYNFTALWFFCWWFHLYSMFLPPCKGQVNTLIAHLFKLSWKRIQRSKINDNNDITQNWTLIYEFQRPPAHFPCLAHKYLTMKLPGFLINLRMALHYELKWYILIVSCVLIFGI